MDAGWDARHPLVRHGGRLRRRPQRVVHRPLARRPPARGAARHDEGLQPGHGRPGRPRPRARPDPAQRRGQPRAARRRPDRPLPRARPRSGHAARRRRSRRSRSCVAEGTIGAWGLSNYDAAGIEEALAHGRPALVQNSYSLLDRERRGGGAAALRRARDRLRPVRPALRRLARRQVRARRRLPRGLADDDAARAVRAPRRRPRLRRPRPRSRPRPRERGVSMAALAFAWVLSHPHVTAAVCGPSRPEHLEPVLAALDVPLSPEERDRIGSFFA